MHHALRIQGILLNIFGHCYPVDDPRKLGPPSIPRDLAALAATCRTFKEPALDGLWSELFDLSPLAFCLAGCRRSYSGCYSFSKPCTEAEWGVLRSYTRRVRCIFGFSSTRGELDYDSVLAAFHTPLIEPLFPNLRFLTWQGARTTLPVMHFAVPSLTTLFIRASSYNSSEYVQLLDTIVSQCPNFREVQIDASRNIQFGDTAWRRYLGSWKRLEVVECPGMAMSSDTIMNLSASVVRLSFTLEASRESSSLDLIGRDPNPPRVFAQLRYLGIKSGSLESVTSFLAQVQFPAVQAVDILVDNLPLKTTVDLYLSTLCWVCSPALMLDLRLLHIGPVTVNILQYLAPVPNSRSTHVLDHPLNLDTLRPCTTFTTLRTIHISIERTIALTNMDLLVLVDAWPHLEQLVLNDQWGWRSVGGTPRGGITLRGLERILRLCGKLCELCVALDLSDDLAGVVNRTTNNRDDDYAENHPEAADVPYRPLDVDLSSRPQFQLDVADSPIRPEWVVPLSVVLSPFGFASRRHEVRFSAWSGFQMASIPGVERFRKLWESVLDVAPVPVTTVREY